MPIDRRIHPLDFGAQIETGDFAAQPCPFRGLAAARDSRLAHRFGATALALKAREDRRPLVEGLDVIGMDLAAVEDRRIATRRRPCPGSTGNAAAQSCGQREY